MIYHTTEESTQAIQQQKAGDWITQQHIILRQLVEQGIAEPIPNGFIISPETITELDHDSKKLLDLPREWDRNIKADITGETAKDNFKVTLLVQTSHDDFTNTYSNRRSIP